MPLEGVTQVFYWFILDFICNFTCFLLFDLDIVYLHKFRGRSSLVPSIVLARCFALVKRRHQAHVTEVETLRAAHRAEVEEVITLPIH